MKRGVHLTFLVLFICCAFSHSARADESVQDMFNRGVSLKDQGRLKEAIPFFEKVIQTKPDFAQAYFELAYDYDFLEQKDKAISFYEEGLKHDPKFIPAYIRLALCYVQVSGDLGKARFYAQEALKRDPGSQEARDILTTIEGKIRTMPGGAELLKNEQKYAKEGIGIYQSGNFTYVGPIKDLPGTEKKPEEKTNE